MDGRKPCARCQREIDEWAKLCPYCNWDQAAGTPPPEAELGAAAPDYTPPAERNWRRLILIAVGIVALLVGSFGLGAFIHGHDAPEDAPEPVTDTTKTDTTASAPPPSPQSVNLVPAGSSDQVAEAPITSAPVADPTQAQPNEYDRHDATAVSSVEYSQLAQRAQAERQRQKALVDPRTLSGPAYAQGAQQQPSIPRRRVAPLPTSRRAAAPPLPAGATAPAPPAAPPQDSGQQQQAGNERWPAGEPRLQVRTRPVALSQPLPSIRVRERSVVSLVLMIGADGSVQDINVRQSIPGEMPRILQAVNRWRFKPATENGQPVAAPYTVDITFNGR